MNKKEFQTLILGALLHDVGKFVIRAKENSEGKDHSQWGGVWLEKYIEHGLPSVVPVYAEFHHGKHFEEIKKSNLNLIVYQADNISAGLDREDDKLGVYEQRQTPLMSIFSRVNLPKKRLEIEESDLGKWQEKSPGSYRRKKTNKNFYFYNLTSLGEEILYPEQMQEIEVNQEQYRSLLDRFSQEFSVWAKNGLSINTLLVLLEKFTSCIPSETKRQEEDYSTYPDISLFDHLKTTGAIAGCMYQYLISKYRDEFYSSLLTDEILNKEKRYFALLGGDFSGVQSFIYTISSTGALKTLRARSFFLELLTEHLVSEVLQSFNLTRANLIYAGGGRFYLLLPNVNLTEESITEKISGPINKWLLKEFGQKLYLALASTSLTASELSSSQISEAWSEIINQLAKEKGRKFNSTLSDILNPEEPKVDSCAICHRDDVGLSPKSIYNREIQACDFCGKFYELGDDLIDAKLIQGKRIDKEEGKGIILPNLDGSFTTYSLERQLNSIKDSNYLLNSWNIAELANIKAIQLFVGNYVRQVKDLPESAQKEELNQGATLGSTASFKGLALSSRGADRIGILRMDVDNLGKIFTFGLEERHRTFSRLTSLSRQLTLFFKYYINQICKYRLNGLPPLDLSEKKPQENRGRNVSLVYSGGDDLFLIGAWDEAVEIAFDIQESFKKFTGKNLSLSGGLVVQDEHFPLYQMARLAGEAEDMAKDNKRDSLTLFYNPALKTKRLEKVNKVKQTFKWGEIEEAILEPLRLFKKLGRIEENRFKPDRDFPHTFIYKLFLLFDQWEREGVMYLPRMAYCLSRLKKAIKDKPEMVEIQKVLMDRNRMVNLRTTLIWLELLMRAGQQQK